MATISFDFDPKIWDDDEREFIWETVELLRRHLANGDRVIITPSRPEKWIDECRDLLMRLGLSLEVFSAPGHPEWDAMRTKSQVLIEQNVTIHLDDMPEWAGLREARSAGIEIRLPPATNAVRIRMY